MERKGLVSSVYQTRTAGSGSHMVLIIKWRFHCYITLCITGRWHDVCDVQLRWSIVEMSGCLGCGLLNVPAMNRRRLFSTSSGKAVKESWEKYLMESYGERLTVTDDDYMCRYCFSMYERFEKVKGAIDESLQGFLSKVEIRWTKMRKTVSYRSITAECTCKLTTDTIAAWAVSS